MISVVEWELFYNALFEVLDESGKMVVLRQNKGLPIGGHLWNWLPFIANLRNRGH